MFGKVFSGNVAGNVKRMFDFSQVAVANRKVMQFAIDVGGGLTFADQFNGSSTRTLDCFDPACAEEWLSQMSFFEPQLDTFDLQLVDVVE